MSLIIKGKIDDIYDLICSRQSICKLFAISDKSCIRKTQSGKLMEFSRIYDSQDLKIIENLKIPEMIGNKLDSYNITMQTEHKIIQRTSSSFIVKYSSILRKPEYLYGMIGDAKIILYAQFTVNPSDKDLVVVHFNEKMVNANEVDSDDLILNVSNNDIISNIYQRGKLVFNDNIIQLSETIFGKQMLNDVILPFVDTVYNTVFDVVKDVYIKRLMKFISRKGLEIYKKK